MISSASRDAKLEPERARRFFADERVVVDLGEALIHKNVAHFVLELALGIAGRHGGGNQGALQVPAEGFESRNSRLPAFAPPGWM